MLNKRLIPVVALLLLVAAVAATGASQSSAVRVPAGAIVESPNARAWDSANQVVPEAPALAAPSAPDAVSLDFSSDSLSSWEALTTAQGNWVASDGRLKQRGGTDGEISNELSVLKLKDQSFANGTFQVQVFPASGEAVGVAFRGSDAGYYRVRLFQNLPNDSAKAFLERVSANGVQTVAVAPAKAWSGYEIGEWQLISVVADGSHLVVKVDGATLFDVKDSALASGWLGVLSVADMGAEFDNVRLFGATGQ